MCHPEWQKTIGPNEILLLCCPEVRWLGNFPPFNFENGFHYIAQMVLNTLCSPQVHFQLAFLEHLFDFFFLKSL